MKVYDIAIIIILILFALKGFKDGFFKTIVSFVGFLIITILAYNLKNIVGDFLVLNFPFFHFNSFFGGASVLNIIFYQGIAFILMFLLLEIIYKIILTVTGIIEKILKLTIILGIPSKILGLLFGFLEGYIIVYLILFFLAQPFISINIQDNSNLMNPILEKTPILSHYGEKGLEVFNELKELSNIDDTNELDLKMADIVLKEKVISKDTFKALIEKEKIKITGIDEIIDKY